MVAGVEEIYSRGSGLSDLRKKTLVDGVHEVCAGVKIKVKDGRVVWVEGERGRAATLGELGDPQSLLERRDLVWTVMRWMQRVGLPGFKSFKTMRRAVVGRSEDGSYEVKKPEVWLREVLQEEQIHKVTAVKNLMTSASGDCVFSERGRVRKLGARLDRLAFAHWDGEVQAKLHGRGLYLFTPTLPKVEGLTPQEAYEWRRAIHKELTSNNGPLSTRGPHQNLMDWLHWSNEETFRSDGSLFAHRHYLLGAGRWLGGTGLTADRRKLTNLVHEVYEPPRRNMKRLRSKGRREEVREALEMEEQAHQELLGVLGVTGEDFDREFEQWRQETGRGSKWGFVQWFDKKLRRERAVEHLEEAQKAQWKREAGEFGGVLALAWCDAAEKHAPDKARQQGKARPLEWLQDLRAVTSLGGVGQYLSKGSLGLEATDGGWFKEGRVEGNLSLFGLHLAVMCWGDPGRLVQLVEWLKWRTGGRRNIRGFSRGDRAPSKLYPGAWKGGDEQFEPPPSPKKPVILDERLICGIEPWLWSLLSKSVEVEQQEQIRPFGLQLDLWVRHRIEDGDDVLVSGWMQFAGELRVPLTIEGASWLLDGLWWCLSRGIEPVQWGSLQAWLKGLGNLRCFALDELRQGLPIGRW